MGVIYDFLKELNEFDIALEADDITTDVISGTDDAVGKDSKDSPNDSSDDVGIDTNTDDLLGSKDDSVDGDPTNTEDDEEKTSDEDSEDNSDQNGEDSSGEDTDGESDDSSVDNAPPPDENDSSFEASRKKKLQKQYYDFYQVIDSDIKLLAEYVPKISDEETVSTLYNINSNLSQCKDYAYQILTEEFTSSEYPALLKKYIALNRIYELAIKTLETYFEKNGIPTNKRVKFNNTTKK